MQWKFLHNRKDLNTPSILGHLKYLHEPLFFYRVIGVCITLLIHIIRENSHVDGAPLILLTNHPHSEVHGSIEGELIQRLNPILLVLEMIIKRLINIMKRKSKAYDSLKP